MSPSAKARMAACVRWRLPGQRERHIARLRARRGESRDNGRAGLTHSPETKERMRAAACARWARAGQREAASQFHQVDDALQLALKRAEPAKAKPKAKPNMYIPLWKLGEPTS